MHSIRTKITLLNIIAISVAITVTTLISAFTIANFGHESSEQSLSLLCESGKNNLNNYFKSVEQSVNTVSHLIDAHLDTISDDEFNTKLPAHMNEARNIFSEAANNTNGVLTYYYRVDIPITEATGEKGFWYVKNKNNVFEEHEVTDLSDDQFECVWFYTPKNTGDAVWLDPYVTDNLNEYVVSYNVPVYKGEEKFIGVVGIEISYNTLGEQIKNIKAQKSGYAFIIENNNGTIIYHPSIDILGMKEEDRPLTPPEFREAFKKGEKHIRYEFEGVKKHCHVMELTNGMSIVVCVPIGEVNDTWFNLVLILILVAVVIIGGFTVFTTLYTRRITKPLKEITSAAEKINEGDYNVKLDYQKNDEIGVLASSMNKLVDHLGEYINDLTNMAYDDALTHVHNKSAYDIALKELEDKLLVSNSVEFAIAIFDCDDLKTINDNYGHDKGNVYLKNASRLIARVFEHSEVYRIGGDEFAIILQGEDYKNRVKLRKQFLDKSQEVCSFAKKGWEMVRVSVGIATFDPEVDRNAEDVMIHADHLMYDNKRERKRSYKNY